MKTIASIERQVEKIENRLGIKETPRVLIIEMHDHEQRCKEYGIPLDLEQWITYKQAKAKSGGFVLFTADPAKELEARKVKDGHGLSKKTS
jgi:hypothetical protein